MDISSDRIRHYKRRLKSPKIILVRDKNPIYNNEQQTTEKYRTLPRLHEAHNVQQSPWRLNNDHTRFLEDSLSNDSNLLTNRNSFHRAIRSALVIAECFGLMPVQGINGPNASALRFDWLRFRVLYSLLLLLAMSFMTLFWTWILVGDGLKFQYITAVVFYATCLVNMILFFRLASQWPCLMLAVHRIELALEPQYGYPGSLASRMKILVSVILTAALLEHGLSVARDIRFSVLCSHGSLSWIRIYLLNYYGMVFQTFPFSHWLGVSLFLIDNLATFAWNFMDLFIMLVSVMLIHRFRQVNSALRAVINKDLPHSFWNQVREDYARMSYMVVLVDSRINKLILLSFWNNLYFVCLQLYNSINNQSWRKKQLADFLYFYLSVGYLLLRSMAVCLYAASVNDESKRPVVVLYSVPSKSYCEEVHRFIMHITGDEVALTALNFFSLTRTLLLTVVGTVITYEMVMVQLHDSSGDMHFNISSANQTRNPFCVDVVLD